MIKSFPVYEIDKFQMNLIIDEHSIDLPLSKISLVSLYFTSSSEVIAFGKSDLRVKFKGKTFNLCGDCNKSIPIDGVYENKVSLYFEKKAEFERWVLFVKVVHKTKLKKLFQNSL